MNPAHATKQAHLHIHRRQDKAAPPSVDHVRRIGQVEVCVATRETALRRLCEAVETARPSIWGFCNAHTVNVARALPAFRSALARMTLFNDGVGLDCASWLLHGHRFPDNLNGTDFVPDLLCRLPPSTPIYLVGSAPGVADKAADAITAHYPHIRIAGVQHGFFAATEEDAIVRRIATSGARLVLVGMGHPSQELWSARASSRLDMALLCVGAFLDFTAGEVQRAPRFIRRLRLEWAYRLMREPRRLARRYLLGNLLFVMCVLLQRVRRGRGTWPG